MIWFCCVKLVPLVLPSVVYFAYNPVACLSFVMEGYARDMSCIALISCLTQGGEALVTTKPLSIESRGGMMCRCRSVTSVTKARWSTAQWSPNHLRVD